MAGLALAAILVARVVQAGMATGLSPVALAGFPALMAKNYAFDQKEIRARVGETIVLRLANADADTHYFDVDELNVHALIPTGKDAVALFVSLILVTIGATPSPEIMMALPPLWWLLATLLGAFGWTAIWIALYLFPDGRFAPRWTRLLAAIFVALQVYQVLASMFPGPPLNGASWPQPPDPVAAPILLGSCLFAQIYRYRRVSGPVQRQQTKWAVFGRSTALAVAVLINNVLGPLWRFIRSNRKVSRNLVLRVDTHLMPPTLNHCKGRKIAPMA